MRTGRLGRLLLAAAMATGLVAVPTLARAQACGVPSKALTDYEQALVEAQVQYEQAIAARDLELVAEMRKLIERIKQGKPLGVPKPCPDIEPKGDFLHTPSLTGVGGDVAFSKQVAGKASGGPTKSQSFLSQQAAGAPGQPGDSLLSGLGFDVVGEVGFDHGGGATLLSFLGGLRVTVALQAKPKLSPFFQFLVGIEHCGVCQYNAFSFQPGFGAVYALKPRLGLVVQLDFRLVPSSENEIRISGGVSIPIGK
jgi:hypothetical protein